MYGILTAMKKKNHLFPHRRLLKWLLNVWTIATIIILIADFFSGNRFDTSATSIGIIYLALLGIYAGDKEYARWRDNFQSRFAGEGFVVIWTIIMAFFVILAAIASDSFKVPEEFAAMYTAIIGVFAISYHSKRVHKRN